MLNMLMYIKQTWYRQLKVGNFNSKNHVTKLIQHYPYEEL